MRKNNGGGGTAPKSGDHYVPLCRNAGFTKTMNAMGNKTKSKGRGTTKHYQYEGCSGTEQGGNVKGWSPE
jgi:hypothetical protein